MGWEATAEAKREPEAWTIECMVRKKLGAWLPTHCGTDEMEMAANRDGCEEQCTV
jgi:hypothetical protein